MLLSSHRLSLIVVALIGFAATIAEAAALNGGPTDQQLGSRMTNAERLARGLAPNRPARRQPGRRAGPSSTPTSITSSSSVASSATSVSGSSASVSSASSASSSSNSVSSSLSVSSVSSASASSSSSAPSAPPTPSCSRSYTVQPGDTCDLISASQSVSAYQLARTNAGLVNAACSNLSVGETLCLGITGQDCTATYAVASGDYCALIADHFGVTVNTLLTNNLNVNGACTNIYVGEVLCVASTIIPYH